MVTTRRAGRRAHRVVVEGDGDGAVREKKARNTIRCISSISPLSEYRNLVD
eukprot:SAG11_NODE_26066_length_350_cov_0.828685_1_plen_50_part_10